MEAVIFSSCDPFHIYYKALMTPQKCTVVKLFFEVIQLTSGFLFFSNSSNKSSPLLNIRISDPGTIRSSCLWSFLASACISSQMAMVIIVIFMYPLLLHHCYFLFYILYHDLLFKLWYLNVIYGRKPTIYAFFRVFWNIKKGHLHFCKCPLNRSEANYTSSIRTSIAASPLRCPILTILV